MNALKFLKRRTCRTGTDRSCASWGELVWRLQTWLNANLAAWHSDSHERSLKLLGWPHDILIGLVRSCQKGLLASEWFLNIQLQHRQLIGWKCKNRTPSTCWFTWRVESFPCFPWNWINLARRNSSKLVKTPGPELLAALGERPGYPGYRGRAKSKAQHWPTLEATLANFGKVEISCSTAAQRQRSQTCI